MSKNNYFKGLKEETTIQDYEGEIAGLKMEIGVLNEQCKLLGKVLEDYDSIGGMETIIGRESENQQLKEQLASFVAAKNEYDNLKEQLDTEVAAKNEVQCKLTMAHTANQKLFVIIKDLREEVAGLKNTNNELSDEIATKKTFDDEIAKRNTDIYVKFEDEIAKLHYKLLKTYEDKSKQAAIINDLKEKYNQLWAKHTKALDDRDQAHIRLEHLITENPNGYWSQPSQQPFQQYQPIAFYQQSPRTTPPPIQRPPPREKKVLKIVPPNASAAPLTE